MTTSRTDEKQTYPDYNDYLRQGFHYLYKEASAFHAVALALLVENFDEQNRAVFEKNLATLFGPDNQKLHSEAIHFELINCYNGNIPASKYDRLSQLIAHFFRPQVLRAYYDTFEKHPESKESKNNSLPDQPAAPYLFFTMSCLLQKKIILLHAQEPITIFGKEEYKDFILIQTLQHGQFGFLSRRLPIYNVEIMRLTIADAKASSKKAPIEWQAPPLAFKDKPFNFIDRNGFADVASSIFSFLDTNDVRHANLVTKKQSWQQGLKSSVFEAITRKFHVFEMYSKKALDNLENITQKNLGAGSSALIFGAKIQEYLKLQREKKSQILWRDKIKNILRGEYQAQELKEDANMPAPENAAVMALDQKSSPANPLKETLLRYIADLYYDEEFYNSLTPDAGRPNDNRYRSLLSRLQQDITAQECILNETKLVGTPLDTKKIETMNKLTKAIITHEYNDVKRIVDSDPRLAHSLDEFYLSPLFWATLFPHDEILALLKGQNAPVIPHDLPMPLAEYFYMSMKIVEPDALKNNALFAEVFAESLTPDQAKALTFTVERHTYPIVIAPFALEIIQNNLPFAKVARILLSKGHQINTMTGLDGQPLLRDILIEKKMKLDMKGHHLAEFFDVLLEHGMDQQFFTAEKKEQIIPHLENVITSMTKEVIEVYFRRHGAFCKTLIPDAKTSTSSLLHTAAKAKRLSTIDFLIAEGFDPLHQDEKGNTILHHLIDDVYFDHYGFSFKEIENITEYIKRLIQRYPVLLTTPNTQGLTPKLKAIRKKNAPLFSLFDKVHHEDKSENAQIEIAKAIAHIPTDSVFQIDINYLTTLSYFLQPDHPFSANSKALTILFDITLGNLLLKIFIDHDMKIRRRTIEMQLSNPHLVIDTKKLKELPNRTLSLLNESFFILLLKKNKATIQQLRFLLPLAIMDRWTKLLRQFLLDESLDEKGYSNLQRIAESGMSYACFGTTSEIEIIQGFIVDMIKNSVDKTTSCLSNSPDANSAKDARLRLLVHLRDSYILNKFFLHPDRDKTISNDAKLNHYLKGHYKEEYLTQLSQSIREIDAAENALRDHKFDKTKHLINTRKNSPDLLDQYLMQIFTEPFMRFYHFSKRPLLESPAMMMTTHVSLLLILAEHYEKEIEVSKDTFLAIAFYVVALTNSNRYEGDSKDKANHINTCLARAGKQLDNEFKAVSFKVLEEDLKTVEQIAKNYYFAASPIQTQLLDFLKEYRKIPTSSLENRTKLINNLFAYYLKLALLNAAPNLLKRLQNIIFSTTHHPIPDAAPTAHPAAPSSGAGPC